MSKITFKQRVLMGFTASLVFVVISAISAYLSISSLRSSAEWVTQSNDMISLAERTEIELLNAESSLDVYLMNGNEALRKNCSQSLSKIVPNLQQLKKLSAINAVQQNNLDSLEVYARLKIENMQVILRSYQKNSKPERYQSLLASGEQYKLNFLRLNHHLVSTERTLLKKHKLITANNGLKAVAIIVLSSILVFALIILMTRYVGRTYNQQKKTERQLLRSNRRLETISDENQYHNWLLMGVEEINGLMRGVQEIQRLADNITAKISHFTNAATGCLFIVDEQKKHFHLSGTYAFQKGRAQCLKFGEGWIGQVAAEQEPGFFNDVPDNYLSIHTGLGHVKITHLYLYPIIFENNTIAVLELGFLHKPDDQKLQLINHVSENISVALNSTMAHIQLRKLYEQTQEQAEELANNQEELRVANEELLHKTEALQASEEELRVQQEELQQANAELEEKAHQLQEKNISINQAKEAISQKAEELEQSSRYKSEFLANMSHELRTPLNSILVLARILKENRSENLTDDQIKYAGVIHNAGSDLLLLINDILDLAKIESGNIDLYPEEIQTDEISQRLEGLFAEIAKQKNIDFKVKGNTALKLKSDKTRVEQILKNLLSNAFKFTPEYGDVTLEIGVADPAEFNHKYNLRTANEKPIRFSVKDNGIGIEEDKLHIIFEAFKQQDGSINREYGGTGLGLSISRELASILHGEIQIESKVGEGSTFTLYLPENLDLENNQHEHPEENIQSSITPEKLIPEHTRQDNEHRSNPLILIVEDDIIFAKVLVEHAIEKGYTPILAHSGDIGYQMAINQLPDAIILDVVLPVMDGWSMLKKLKSNPATKHIPVHMMSAGNENESKAEQEGALGFMQKPVDLDSLNHAFELFAQRDKYSFKHVLIVEDQILQSDLLKEQLISRGVEVYQAYTGETALEILAGKNCDCIILDIKLPDISGLELLDKIKANPDLKHIPVIINTAMELDKESMAHIMKYTAAMVLKTSKSNDRLLDEVSLFMNKLSMQSLDNNVAYPSPLSTTDPGSATIEKVLMNKTVLIADDDMRNIFALSSALQFYEIKIIIANNGQEAIQKLKEHPEVNLVLMDIMMPVMDGYEAIKNIRANKLTARIPIITLTAKAMKSDRLKCLQVGANDYISKPINIDQLLSLMRVWLS